MYCGAKQRLFSACYIVTLCCCIMQQHAAEDVTSKQRPIKTPKVETLRDLAQKASRKKRTPIDKGHQVAEQQKETALSLSDVEQVEAACVLVQLSQNQPVESSIHDK